MSERIRILLVEDHQVVRQGLVALLSVSEDLEVVGAVGDGVEAVGAFRKTRPDVTLMDLQMPKLGGVETIRQIREEFPQARVIVLTTYDGDEDIYRALQAGARAYLLKGVPLEELVATIHAVHDGKLHIPPAVAAKLAERLSSEALTARELGVLERIVAGRANKEISADLFYLRSHGKDTHQQLVAKAGRSGQNTRRDRCNSAWIGESPMKSSKAGVLLAGVLLLLPSAAALGQVKKGWRQATPAELEAVLPARATVEKEHIETEMRTASGAIDAHGKVIAAVVLITAGYSANGKYSHYLLAQTPVRVGNDILLPAGAYVVGWTRETDGLSVHLYEAESGIERGTITARPMTTPLPIVSIKVWPPGEHSFIQIGRFAVPYKPED